LGTVIAKENGVDDDQFFLAFDHLAGVDGAITPPGQPVGIQFVYDPGDAHVVGLRTFDEINATMSELTGVPATAVLTDFERLKQQMPSSEDMGGFLSSQQMSIANLAGIYCGKLVENEGSITRADYFGVNDSVFTSAVGTAFPTNDTSDRDQIIDALRTKMIGTSLTIQPEDALVNTELTDLFNYLRIDDAEHSCDDSIEIPNTSPAQTQSCSDQTRTRAIIKAMCMGVLGSAAVTHQ
jgi:hypothetical protein